jgi:hypothetical protein
MCLIPAITCGAFFSMCFNNFVGVTFDFAMMSRLRKEMPWL